MRGARNLHALAASTSAERGLAQRTGNSGETQTRWLPLLKGRGGGWRGEVAFSLRGDRNLGSETAGSRDWDAEQRCFFPCDPGLPSKLQKPSHPQRLPISWDGVGGFGRDAPSPFRPAKSPQQSRP